MKLIRETKQTTKTLSTCIHGSFWNPMESTKGLRLSSSYPDYSLEFDCNDDIDELIEKLEELKKRGV